MAYAALSTIQTIATGQVFTAATLQQANDNDEALIDPPACSIKETTAQSIPNNTATAMTSDEENFDNDSMHSTVSNTSRITAQTAGRYLCLAALAFANDNDSTLRAVLFRVNGTTSHTAQSGPAVNGNSNTVTGMRILTLAAGDYVECMAQHIAGVSINVTLSEFALYRLTR